MTFANRLFTLSFVICLWLVLTGHSYWGALVTFGGMMLVTGIWCEHYADKEREFEEWLFRDREDGT